MARAPSVLREGESEIELAVRHGVDVVELHDLHSLVLNNAQIRRLIESLGSRAPEGSEGLVEILTGLLRGAGDAAVEITTR